MLRVCLTALFVKFYPFVDILILALPRDAIVTKAPCTANRILRRQREESPAQTCTLQLRHTPLQVLYNDEAEYIHFVLRQVSIVGAALVV
jgi:hypothetical protein